MGADRSSIHLCWRNHCLLQEACHGCRAKTGVEHNIWRYAVSRNALKPDSKIYDVPNVGTLRRIRRPDGISFLTVVARAQNGGAGAGSVEVELRLLRQRGIIALTLRRIVRTPESWHCGTSTIHLPPAAAADLARSLTEKPRGLEGCGAK
jgi:hypothetical protein